MTAPPPPSDGGGAKAERPRGARAARRTQYVRPRVGLGPDVIVHTTGPHDFLPVHMVAMGCTMCLQFCTLRAPLVLTLRGPAPGPRLAVSSGFWSTHTMGLCCMLHVVHSLN